MSERTKELLCILASRIEEGRFIDHDFLSENEVTLTELRDLQDTLSLVLFGYVGCSEDDRLRLLMAGALTGSGMDERLVHGAMEEHRMIELRRKMAKT